MNNDSITPSTETEIVTFEAPQEAQPAPAVPAETPTQIQRVAELHREMRVATLRATRPHHWLDMGGTPYLTAAGCQQLRSLFRVRFDGISVKIEERDGVTVALVTGRACSEVLDGGGWITEVGTADSNDRLLTRGGTVKAALGDIIKKAMTNFSARAIRTVLGLGGVTWEDLAAVGVGRDRIPRVTFAGASVAGSGQMVLVTVPFKHKDEFKALVRKHLGITPKFQLESKQWEIPKEALEVEEIRAQLAEWSQKGETTGG